MREYILTDLEDLVVETLPNSVFNYLVSHVLPRTGSAAWACSVPCRRSWSTGSLVERLVQEPEWMADGASQLRYQSRTGNVLEEVAVLVEVLSAAGQDRGSKDCITLSECDLYFSQESRAERI